MDLRTVLTTDTVNLHLKGTTKEQIVDEMLDVLYKAGKVTDKAAARECVLDRERKMSTGMKHGIAIPHGKTDTVSDLVACIGISDNPVDFDSLDQEPCRIFIMTLSPVNKTGPHLQFLAEVSLLFKSPEKRQEILDTQDKAEVIRILTEQDLFDGIYKTFMLCCVKVFFYMDCHGLRPRNDGHCERSAAIHFTGSIL